MCDYIWMVHSRCLWGVGGRVAGCVVVLLDGANRIADLLSVCVCACVWSVVFDSSAEVRWWWCLKGGGWVCYGFHWGRKW